MEVVSNEKQEVISGYVLWIELCPRLNSCNPTVTAFGNRASKEVIKIKRDHEGGALIQQD